MTRCGIGFFKSEASLLEALRLAVPAKTRAKEAAESKASHAGAVMANDAAAEAVPSESAGEAGELKKRGRPRIRLILFGRPRKVAC